jgi:hypothetical protein
VTQEYPPPGSLRELVLQLVLMKKEYNEMEKTRLQIQAVVDSSGIGRGWKDYTARVFPWSTQTPEQEAKRVKEALSQDTAGFYVRAQPTVEEQFRSKLHEQAAANARARLRKSRDKVLPNVRIPGGDIPGADRRKR